MENGLYILIDLYLIPIECIIYVTALMYLVLAARLHLAT